MSNIFQHFFSKLSENSNAAKSAKKVNNGSRPFVKYLFHVPGAKNFHLLPFRSKRQGSLNIFKPHWNRVQSKTMR
jgi:hypothetical protein